MELETKKTPVYYNLSIFHKVPREKRGYSFKLIRSKEFFKSRCDLEASKALLKKEVEAIGHNTIGFILQSLQQYMKKRKIDNDVVVFVYKSSDQIDSNEEKLTQTDIALYFGRIQEKANVLGAISRCFQDRAL